MWDENASVAPLIEALESGYKSLQVFFSDLPPVVIVVGPDKTGKKYGHFHNHQFVSKDGKEYAEIFFNASEGLNRPPVNVFATLIHEAVHCLADVREIKDTSRQGRYHNKEFKKLANEMGLEIEYSKSIGWSHTTLPQKTIDDHFYQDDIDKLSKAITVVRKSLKSKPEAKVKRPPPPLKVYLECPCGRTLKITDEEWNEGPLVCGLCNDDFKESEDS